MSKHVKLTLFGILLGLLGNLIGFLVYGAVFSAVNNIDFSMFYNTFFLKIESFRAQIITGSMLVNVLLFFYFMKTKQDYINRGLMITILFSVMAIIYYFS